MTVVNQFAFSNMNTNPFAAYTHTFVYNPSATAFNTSNPYINAANYANFLLKNINTNFKFTMPTINFKSGNFATTSTRLNSGFGSSILNNAYKYLGYNENDGSYKLFTNGRTEAWCADFVSHVVKESCRQNGKSVPSGFGSASVEGLRQWGKANNCYLHTANSSNKESLIRNNVKKGDVIIFKENGKSHTGFFDGIDAQGRIRTIEGNTSDKVAVRTYSINDSSISGFVQLA